MMLSNPPDYPPLSLSASLPAVIRDHNTEGEGRATPSLVGNVLALRTHWEMEASRNSTEELRRLPFPQLDKNGYVSDPLSTLRIPVPLSHQTIDSQLDSSSPPS